MALHWTSFSWVLLHVCESVGWLALRTHGNRFCFCVVMCKCPALVAKRLALYSSWVLMHVWESVGWLALPTHGNMFCFRVVLLCTCVGLVAQRLTFYMVIFPACAVWRTALEDMMWTYRMHNILGIHSHVCQYIHRTSTLSKLHHGCPRYIRLLTES